MTSACGSADVLETLGVATDLSPEEAGAALHTDGFAFLFAMAYHPAMKHAGPTRREIGVRTAFNLLGPVTNPAGAQRQVVGVGDPSAAPRLAEVLRLLGTQRSFIVHGAGIDELPLDGTGVLYDVTPGGVKRRPVVASQLGLTAAPLAALAGGSPAENAALVESVLAGEPGPRRDVVLLNAAAALLVAGRVGALADGIPLAAATIDSGAAKALLARLRSAKTARDQAKAEAARAMEATPA
jgi:anthranilate phosphoribosyltransferase